MRRSGPPAPAMRRAAGARIARTHAFSAVFVLSAALGACSEPEPEPRPASWTPPEVMLEGADHAVREAVTRQRDLVHRLAGRADVNPRRLARAIGRLGMVHLAHEHAEAAVACFEEASRSAGDFEWWYLLGLARLRAGDAEGSVLAWEEALRIRATDTATLTRLGLRALEAGDLERAEELLDAAIEHDPPPAAALAGRGRLALLRDRPQSACTAFERALAWDPTADDARYGLASCLDRLGRSEEAHRHRESLPSQALYHRRARLVDPLSEEVDDLVVGGRSHEIRGLAALRAGRFRLAALEFRQALAADPDRVYSLFGAAEAARLLGDVTGARTSLEELLRVDPDFAPALESLARLPKSGEGARRSPREGRASGS